MASAPLNWLLKVGGATLKTTAQTLSEAINSLYDSITGLSTSVTQLNANKADTGTVNTALANLDAKKLNVSDLLSLEEIEASTSLVGKGASAAGVKALTSSLGGLQFGYDSTTKKYGYWKKEAGSEEFVPFKSGRELPYYLGNFGHESISCLRDTMVVSSVKFDLTDVKSISFNVGGTTQNGYPFTAGVCDVVPSSMDAFLCKTQITVANSTIKMSLDVSDLVGEYYLCFYSNMNVSGSYYRTVTDVLFSTYNALVPVVTNATPPYGEVLYDYNNSNYPCWRAFDGDKATGAIPNGGTYIGYKFPQPVVVKQVTWSGWNSNYPSIDSTSKLCGSNNGTTWVEICTLNGRKLTTKEEETQVVNNNVAYTHYKVTLPTTYSCGFSELQFYE